MFGLTEFNVFKDKKGYYIALVTGKNNTKVLVGKKRHETSSQAYDVAVRWWKKIEKSMESGEILLPVRMMRN